MIERKLNVEENLKGDVKVYLEDDREVDVDTF